MEHGQRYDGVVASLPPHTCYITLPTPQIQMAYGYPYNGVWVYSIVSRTLGFVSANLKNYYSPCSRVSKGRKD